MERYITTTYRSHELKFNERIMSLLACIYMVSVFVESQFLVDGPGMSFVGESFVRRLCRHAATVPFFLESTLPSLASFSSCEAVMARVDWAADKFVWARLPNERFRPQERFSVPVLARPPKKRCCHLLWYAGFRNRQLYSNSCVGLRWAKFPMAPVTAGYICHYAESDFAGVPSSLLRC